MSYGTNIKFGIALQNSAGNVVAAAGSYHHVPLLSEDIGLEKSELNSQNLNGSFAPGAVFDGINKVAGTITMEALPRQLGALLSAVINEPIRTPSGTALCKWEFLPRTVDFDVNNCNRPMTVYKQFADASSGEQYSDVQFSDIEFSLSAGQLLKVAVSAVGGFRTANGATVAVPIVAQDLDDQFMWDVASIGYGGAGVSNFSDISIKVSEQIDPLYGLNGSLAPLKYTRKAFRDVIVNGTFFMSDRTVLNDFVSSTRKRLTVSLVNSRIMVQSGYFNTLELDVPNMKITTFKPGASGPGEVSVKFTGRGMLDATSNYQFKATLTNTYQQTAY
jgi:hypothetical protein